LAGARIRHHANRRRAAATADYPEALRRHFSLAATAEAAGEISAWPGYRPSALTPLQDLAAEFGLGAIHYKDESGRFGLGSFKALGGAYAVLSVLQRQVQAHTGQRASARDLEGGRFSDLAARTTVVTATDGNHGRSVAWGAARFGCACRIYIHAAVSERRARAMSQLGAQVVRIRGNYDESVRLAAAHARANHWHLVSDTSGPGYTDLPAKVMAGYSVMMEEIAAQLPARPPRAGAGLTHVFVQGGVGGLAASVAAYLWEKWGARRPRFIVVEPQLAACLFQSARHGRATEVRITEETVMAGLSCGEVSMLAWQVLSAAADDFLTITDQPVAPMMRILAHGEARVEAGESAVAGLAACLAARANPALAAALGLNRRSQVLVFGTEGATDRDIYRAMVRDGGPGANARPVRG